MPPQDANPTPSFGGFGLTGRELEVLRLVALGLETKEIADEFGLSPHTVLNHVRNARKKLHVKSTLAAVISAQHSGLL